VVSGRVDAGRLFWADWAGGAVKAAGATMRRDSPRGRVRLSALRAPVVQLSPAIMDVDRRQAALAAPDGWTQRTSPLLVLSWATENSATGHSFASSAWCVYGHSQTGSFSFDGHATMWGPRRSSSSRPGCVRACSSGLLAQAADVAVSQPVVGIGPGRVDRSFGRPVSPARPSEPDVRVPTHPALHSYVSLCHATAGASALVHGDAIGVPR
jgi:hypothetical protein